MSGPWQRWPELDPLDLVLRLTLLDLVLRPVGDWALRFPILGLAAAGLLLPAFLRRRELWAALALLTGIRVAFDWPLSDNHAYLLCYWCLAIALSRFARDEGRLLSINGRWLIALVFGFATLWKLLSPDFADATFFRATLLLDPRFEGFTRLVGGLSIEQIDAARSALERHADGGWLAPVAATRPSARFEILARATTLWTVTIEAAVTIAFCWPKDRGPSRLRDPLLIAFCVTTYAVATVDGFGWLLIAMGLSQCAAEQTRTRVAYLAAYALILFYREVDWIERLANLVDRA